VCAKQSQQEGGDTPWAQLVERSLREWEEQSEEKSKSKDAVKAKGGASGDAAGPGVAAAAASASASAESEQVPTGAAAEDLGPAGEGTQGMADEADPRVIRDEQWWAARTVLCSTRHDPGLASFAYLVNFMPKEEATAGAEDDAVAGSAKGGNLFEACGSGRLAEVKKLLAGEGSALEVLETCQGGHTALHLAAQGGHAEVVKELVAKGVAVNQANDAGRTALHCAVLPGCHTVVAELAAANADLSAHDKEGETALHTALWFQDVETVRALVVAKADPSAANSKGQKPVEMAKGFGFTSSLLQILSDPVAAAKGKRKMPNPRLELLFKGAKAVYEPTGEDVEVVKVHVDGEEPYFTVKTKDGGERQTVVTKLKPRDTQAEEREAKRRQLASENKRNIYVQGIPTDDPTVNGFFLERHC